MLQLHTFYHYNLYNAEANGPSVQVSKLDSESDYRVRVSMGPQAFSDLNS